MQYKAKQLEVSEYILCIKIQCDYAPSGKDPDSQIPFLVFKTNEVAGRRLSSGTIQPVPSGSGEPVGVAAGGSAHLPRHNQIPLFMLCTCVEVPAHSHLQINSEVKLISPLGLSICVAVRCACSFLHYIALLDI